MTIEPQPELHSVTVDADDLGVILGIRIDGVPVLVAGDGQVTVTASKDGVMIVSLPLLCKAFNTNTIGKATDDLP